MIPVKVTISSTTDLQPALIDFARAAQQVAGEPAGDVTAALERVEQKLDAELPEQAREAAQALRAGLPKGVRLVELTQQRSGLEVTSSTTLELDDVAALSSVKLFEGFAVKKTGAAVSVQGTAPEGRVTLVIDCAVVAPSEHNAASVSGNRLRWEGSAFDVKLGF